jgi:hypothetical protein
MIYLINRFRSLRYNPFLCVIYILLYSALCRSNAAFARGLIPASETKTKFGSVRVVELSGSYQEMGTQYGHMLQSELKEALAILKNFYIKEHHISYDRVLEQANKLFTRFPLDEQLFIQGVSKGSGLTLDDVKILNAMETLGRLLRQPTSGGCAFVLLPQNKTNTQAPLIGRNYDFRHPYDELAKYLIVTVLKSPDKIPTAFISIVGEIYCPTCINAKGIFMELNNGTASGGFYIEENREAIFAKMLQISQNSMHIAQADFQLNSMQSDYSLIINVADKDQLTSYEYSSSWGMKKVIHPMDDFFVSTNFYLSSSWIDIPQPYDTPVWQSVTRRNNLLALVTATKQFNIDSFKKLMDTKISAGGAALDLTIYQLIFDRSDFSLYIKINKESDQWNKIPLKQYF